MSVGVTLEELLAWNDESSSYWKIHFEANPSLLELPCDIGGAMNVQSFVRHIWSVELRWAQRLAGLPVLDRDKAPSGALETLFQFHREAMEIYRNLLAAPEAEWDEIYVIELDWIPADLKKQTRRKVAAHSFFHSQRHWAQLATLVRRAGFPAGFHGDLLFSLALR
jgi:uncharacterized damage-inducible protein DinB